MDIIKSIKDKISILDYIEATSGLGPINQVGEVYYFNKCPICGGYKGLRKFSVNTSYKTFYCPNCRNTGDIITFHMKKYKKTFKGSIRDLKKYI